MCNTCRPAGVFCSLARIMSQPCRTRSQISQGKWDLFHLILFFLIYKPENQSVKPYPYQFLSKRAHIMLCLTLTPLTIIMWQWMGKRTLTTFRFWAGFCLQPFVNGSKKNCISSNDLVTHLLETPTRSNDLVTHSLKTLTRSNDLVTCSLETPTRSNDLTTRWLETVTRSNELVTRLQETLTYWIKNM